MPFYSIPIKIVAYNYMKVKATSLEEAIEKVKSGKCSKDNLNEPVDCYEYYEHDQYGENFEVDENNKIIKTIKQGK